MPRLTWQQALAMLCSQRVRCLSGDPQHLLARVTTPGTGHAGAAGTIIPDASNVLSYVFTWTDVPCAPAGGAGTPGSSAAPLIIYACVIMQPVDANTGAPSAGEYESPKP